MSNEYESTIRELQNSVMRCQEQSEVWMNTSEKFSKELYMAKLSIGRYEKIISQIEDFASKKDYEGLSAYIKQVTRNQ